MKASWKRALALALALCLVLAGCGGKEGEPSAQPSEQPTPQPTPSAAAERPAVNLAVLSGPTGVGAAKLLFDSDAGVTQNDYHYTICTENPQVTAGLTSGEFDIAAVATNVAANLYNKSNGGVQLAAINTLGVLYILAPAASPVYDLSELQGKTLYATGQGANPQYALDYLLTESGLDPKADVEIVWGTADEVNQAMLTGQADACMLPVPAATALEAKSEGKIKSCISLSDVWDELQNGSQLTMGCVVVRTEFAEEHPEVVSAFLEEYAASIAFMAAPESMALSSNDNPAQLVAAYGLAPNAAIAGKAIPQCNLVCLTGEEMRSAIQGYYEVLYQADPNSIGGSIPDDAFYFLAD